MRQSLSLLLTGALAALSIQLVSSRANAADNPCQIELRADAQCTLEPPSAQCEAKCTPLSVEVACSAQLYVGCDGQCTASASVMCQADCSASCSAQCMAQGPQFDCAASCNADCSANCDAQCAASADKGRCGSSCRSTCSGECDAKCSVTPPSADCDAKCKASCDGSCDAQANFDCQIQCQSKGYAQCETDVQGGCVTQCQTKEGALFCDGNYVDPKDQLDACMNYLEDQLKIDIQGYARGDASCSGNQCTAEGEAGFSCAAAPAGASEAPMNEGALALAAIGAGIFAVRRRRSSKR